MLLKCMLLVYLLTEYVTGWCEHKKLAYAQAASCFRIDTIQPTCLNELLNKPFPMRQVAFIARQKRQV